MRRLRKSNWLSALYVALAALYAVPIWSVRYMPLVDGPSHLYNSSILLKLLTGRAGRLAAIYQIDWHPIPNWLGHIVEASRGHVMAQCRALRGTAAAPVRGRSRSASHCSSSTLCSQSRTIAIDRARTQESRVFGAILLAFVVLYFIAPKIAAGGGGINDRIGYFLYLLPVAWFTPSLPRAARTAFVALLSTIAIANAVFLTMHFHSADRVLKEIVRTFDAAPPEKAFIALLYDTRPPGSLLGLMSHTVDYAAVARNLIDLTKMIFTWKMPAQTQGEIEERYRLANEWGLGRLYIRK